MPLNEKELLERDAKRNSGEELLEAIRDVKAGNYGATYTVEPNEIVVLRVKCGLSQSQFAKALQFHRGPCNRGNKDGVNRRTQPKHC